MPALATITHAAMSGLSAVGTAHAASDFSLVTLPDQGENAIYNSVNSASSSINVTIYELNDVTLENDLVSREKVGADVRVILDQAQKSYGAVAALAGRRLVLPWRRSRLVLPPTSVMSS